MAFERHRHKLHQSDVVCTPRYSPEVLFAHTTPNRPYENSGMEGKEITQGRIITEIAMEIVMPVVITFRRKYSCCKGIPWGGIK